MGLDRPRRPQLPGNAVVFRDAGRHGGGCRSHRSCLGPAGTVGAAGPTALASSVSTDGGQSWAAPVQVVNDGVYDDRESVSADPFRPGRAYFTSVRRLGGFGESGLFSFASTTDGGRTWS